MKESSHFFRNENGQLMQHATAFIESTYGYHRVPFLAGGLQPNWQLNVAQSTNSNDT
jgi:hypothetical protein